MSHKQNDKIADLLIDLLAVKDQNYDNLFSARHRKEMISRYGYTDAETITVGALMENN